MSWRWQKYEQPEVVTDPELDAIARLLRRLFVALVAIVLLCFAVSRAFGLARPNILLIVVDALAADHMSWYGYKTSTRASSLR